MNQHSLQHLVHATLLVALATPNAGWAQAKAALPIDRVIGKLQSFDGKTLDVGTPSGVVHVIVKQPLTTYKQIPSDLNHVAAASYIGVASAEGADGKQVAKQIFACVPHVPAPICCSCALCRPARHTASKNFATNCATQFQPVTETAPVGMNCVTGMGVV